MLQPDDFRIDLIDLVEEELRKQDEEKHPNPMVRAVEIIDAITNRITEELSVCKGVKNER